MAFIVRCQEDAREPNVPVLPKIALQLLNDGTAAAN